MSFNHRDSVFFILSAAVMLIYILSADGGFPLDDSWIHQVYGRNLGDNGEWAFIPGEPSAASTSPLYTILLSISYFFNIPYQFWTHLLGVLALSATAMLGARISLRLRPNDEFCAWITGFTLILSWHLIWAAVSGMETMLIGMFSLLLIYRVWIDVGDPTRQRGALFGVITALATMTRPEGAMLGGLCGLVLLILHRQKLIHWSVAAAVGFGVVIAPYIWLNLDLTGGVLPATSDAKYAQLGQFLEQPYVTRVLGMALPMIAGGQLLLIPGLIYFMWQRLSQISKQRETLIELLPIIWAVALVMLYAARLPASYQHGRYVIPALPALLVVGVSGTFGLYHQGRRSVVGRVLSRSLAISAVLTFLYFGVVLGPQVYAKDVQIINEEMVDPANWINVNIPEDELLATHDIGAVGYFAPRHLVDIAGLVTEEVVPIIGDEVAMWAYLQGRDAQYLMAFPDQIPGDNVNDARLCPLYQSNGTTAINAGGNKMVVYRLAWDRNCQ